MSASVLLSGIEHHFDGVLALSNIELSIAPGETAALIGPSGAGKSTLLALLDGRLRGWSGAAVVLEQALNPAEAPHRDSRADVGFIFQDFALIERMTVHQNVMSGRLGRTGRIASLLGRFTDRDRALVQSVLDDTGLAELAERRVDKLSGGQRQRVAIARCLAQEPKLILADEPVSNLDPERAKNVLELIAEQARKRNVGVIFTSHQPDLAKRFASRIIGLKDGCILFDKSSSALRQGDIDTLYGGEVKSPSNELRLVV
ncbi:MAG: phosphonate ABC transporter ATP-binding protein [Pikeienuella sp.]